MEARYGVSRIRSEMVGGFYSPERIVENVDVKNDMQKNLSQFKSGEHYRYEPGQIVLDGRESIEV